MKDCKLFGLVFVAIVAGILFIYGCYWVAKTVSYKVFYERMVRATITEMVNPECVNRQ